MECGELDFSLNICMCLLIRVFAGFGCSVKEGKACLLVDEIDRL